MRRLGERRYGAAGQESFAVVAPHDVPQRRVGLHGRGIDADALALDQPRLGDQHQNPVEDRRVDFMGQARAAP